MSGHLRLLNIACAAKAKLRVLSLTKPSREAPLPFTLLGGSEQGFRIFVDSVEADSKAAEVGLKRGDQVWLPCLPPHLRRLVALWFLWFYWFYPICHTSGF